MLPSQDSVTPAAAAAASAPDADTAALIAAYERAVAMAGEVKRREAMFTGAFNAAENAGYEYDSPAWNVFVFAFVSEFPPMICLDAQGFYLAPPAPPVGDEG